MLYVMCAISSNYYGSVQLRSVSDSGCNWNLHRKIVLWEFWVVSCINVVRRFSWLSNFQLNNLHNVCVSRVNGEESEQFAKYFSFRIIINSAMIKFSLSCEMVLVNINIYTPSVICRFMVEGGCSSNFWLAKCEQSSQNICSSPNNKTSCVSFVDVARNWIALNTKCPLINW